jgi:ABC-type multidrug transport system fused ATPase/permease subunit
LANIVRNRVTFIIAHRLSTIQLANKVVVLHKGRVESIGTHDELVRTSPVYRNLYALGFSDRESSAGNVDSRGETA